MAGSLNKVMIIGNVGRDPEMRYTPSGAPVTSFTVACNYRWTSPEGEPREETEWFNIVAWNKLAEQCSQYVTKGRKVYIEGRLRTRSWEGQDGQKRYRTEVIATQMILLDSRQPDGRPRTSSASDEPFAEGDVEADEIPF